MPAYDTGENGVLFMITSDGGVRFGDFIQSTSEEMQKKMMPILNKIVPKVREYFEELLKKEMRKEVG